VADRKHGKDRSSLHVHSLFERPGSCHATATVGVSTNAKRWRAGTCAVCAARIRLRGRFGWPSGPKFHWRRRSRPLAVIQAAAVAVHGGPGGSPR
jgi:hypothetical protein